MKLSDECFINEVHSGWYGILHSLVEKLNSLGWDSETMQVAQVKEKFGALRFYADGVTKEMAKAISETENLSEIVCEHCGSEGRLRNTGGWYLTLCEGCFTSLIERNK